MSKTPLLGSNDHSRLINDGYICEKAATGPYRDTVYDVFVYKKNIPEPERICKLATAVIASIVSCCMIPCFDICCNNADLIGDFIDVPISGFQEKKFTRLNQVASDKLHEEDARQLGFDSKKRDTIIAFLSKEENRNGFQEAYGHWFKLYYCPSSHFSCFFFVPFKDLSKAGVMHAWNDNSGGPLNTARLLELAIEHCACFREGQGTELLYQERLVPVVANVHQLAVEVIDRETGKQTTTFL